MRLLECTAIMAETYKDIQHPLHTPDTTAHEADMQGGHRTLHSNDPTQPRPGPCRAYHSPLMLSDPLDSSTSDTRSFDEDDMYRSDSDVETISLKRPCKAPASESDASLVCPESLTFFCFLHFIQDMEVHLQLERLEIGMGRAAAMLEASCHAEGIDPMSSLTDAECTASALLQPDGPPAEDVNRLDT